MANKVHGASNLRAKIPNKLIHRMWHYTRKNGKWKPKRKFETEEAAQEFLKSNMIFLHDKKLNVYCCPYCHKWHIGHNKKGDQI